jgi:hypothetical protein
LALLTLAAALTPVPGLSRFYFNHQDSYVITGLVGLLCAMAVPGGTGVARTLPNLRLDRRRVAVVATAMAALLWGGTYVLLDNYPLTRDEHMVVFDMAIFRSGHLAAAMPPAWRVYSQALTPAFLLPLPGSAAWVSSYMPMNAMMRAAFAGVLDPALMNPMLAAVGAVALFDIAERLFPQNRSAQAVALLLYATSAQVLVTAMTTYAMTGHLALNLVWLALFLRGTRASHAGAIAVGFLAIGLHQVIFHPLFAVPFIEHLRRRGEWRTAATYAFSYGAFGLFWISYPHLVAASAGLNASSGIAAGGSAFFSDRVLPLLVHRDPVTLPLIAVNLVRFVTWQNLALIPLMAVAFGAIRRNKGFARPLAYGIVLTIVAMGILLPYQGHGWGYRYLHGLIGNCALLAAYGWRDFSARDEVRTLFSMGTFATLFVSLPFLLWQTHAFVEPYARVNRAIEHLDADIVVVENEGPGFAVDEVRNRPDLANRPIRLAGKALEPADIAVLCSRGTVAFVDVAQMQGLGLGVGNGSNSNHFRSLLLAAGSRCRARGNISG